jgi:hypothetical protein
MRYTFLAPLILLASCGSSADDQLIEMAKERVAGQLPARPPPQFRNVGLATTDMGRRMAMVCGEVMMPTRGWRRFIFSRQAGTTVIDQTELDIAGELGGSPDLRPLWEQSRHLFDEQWGDCSDAGHPSPAENATNIDAGIGMDANMISNGYDPNAGLEMDANMMPPETAPPPSGR